ncbi:MAG TPA: hypothetical protein GXX14_06100 [Clostridiaceae bacterium]|nr:hypothetical protein [Clostridiaceae bacterium]
MENQEIQVNKPQEFKFKLERAEKNMSLLALVLFYFSFTRNDALSNIIFFGVTSLVIIYYFIWYRKKPAYVIINDEEVVIHKFPFFKPLSIKTSEIKNVTRTNKAVCIEHSSYGQMQLSKIYRFFLQAEDIEKIYNTLNNSQ